MYRIEPIAEQQDDQVRAIIQQVGAEFGAVGEGFGPGDAEVTAMSRYYRGVDRGYWVALVDGEVVGCGGVAPFDTPTVGSGLTGPICELRKLFLLPQYRGQGIGRALTVTGLQFATDFGYRHCYLDTLSSMQAARQLYRSLGFIELDAPLPGTPHGGCDVWMLKQL
ncbi:MAG TPA: GNAT family N-acetyltransferase [Gammaproteobacteria bacterium]|nr:GNAT family N-acetyltransferase [Gammaproteobacteria bacterium]